MELKKYYKYKHFIKYIIITSMSQKTLIKYQNFRIDTFQFFMGQKSTKKFSASKYLMEIQL